MRRTVCKYLNLLVLFAFAIQSSALSFKASGGDWREGASQFNRDWIIPVELSATPTPTPVSSPNPSTTPASTAAGTPTSSPTSTLNPQPTATPSSTPLPKNGIYVTPVKVLDDRSVSQNLQQLEANLANARFFDQNSLSAAIGTLQGARMNSSSLSLAVTTQPSPSLETATTTDTAANGDVTKKVYETEKQSSNAASAPPTVQPTSAFVPPSAFRISAPDLLAEQMSMTYQIINLRTFLQRSLSDRRMVGTYTKKSTDGKGNVTSMSERFSGARALVTLGFEISVKNPEEFKDAVAEVQIEIANKTTTGFDGNQQFTAVYDQSPSLVMLSPVEKTYNVATITKDAKSFSLGAAVQVLNIGLATERRSETLYLVRDNDTVGFSEDRFTGDEFENNACNNVSDKAVSFGWQFRPVLGRRSVEPGPRKVMAMIALPNSTNLPYQGTVRIKTRWLKFDKKRKVVGEQIGGAVSQCSEDLEVPSLQETRESLSPRFDPKWTTIGGGMAEIALQGENFLPGTSVLIGDTTFNQATPGFRHIGENEIRFVVPVQKLAQFSDIFISSDYGGLQPIRNSLLTAKVPSGFEPQKNPGWGAKIAGVTAAPVDAQNVELTIKMVPVTTGARPTLSDDLHHAVVSIGDQVYDTRAAKIIDDPNDSFAKLIVLKVPFAVADAAGNLSVRDFFWGTDYASSFPIDLSPVFMVKKVEVLSTDDKATWLAVRGSNFRAASTTISVAGKDYSQMDANNFKFRSPSLIELKVDLPETQLKNIKQLMVSNGSIYLSAQVASPAPKLSVQIDRAGAVAEGEVKDIKLEGANLNNVSYVLFVNDRIPFSAGADGKSASLTVTRDLSKTRGNQQLNLVLKDGTVVPYLLRISSP